MNEWVIFLPLFTMGLISSGHCIGMCGGIMGALTMAIPASATQKRWAILISYNIGRILSYAVMGLLAGVFAQQFAALGGGIILRVLAGLLLIAMGLYLADWWRGLTKLETIGRYLWVYLQPLSKNIMPVNNIPKALLLGALWGWLPCGLVYSALVSAMTQPVPVLAAGSMIAFGLGTLPAVLAAGIAAQQLTRFLQQRQVRIGLAILIMLYGAWTIYGVAGGEHHHHSSTGEHDHMQMQHDMQADAMSGHDHTHMDHMQIDHSQMDHSETMMHDHEHMHHEMMSADESSVAASSESSHIH